MRNGADGAKVSENKEYIYSSKTPLAQSGVNATPELCPQSEHPSPTCILLNYKFSHVD